MVKDVTTSHMAVGKFGHKAQVPSLKHFAADAYLNEIGITTPFFPTENCPQRDCSLVVGVQACDMVDEPEDDGSDPPPLVVSLVVPLLDPPEPDPVVAPDPDPSDGWSLPGTEPLSLTKSARSRPPCKRNCCV